ncbi:LysR family transcriptional regulator [Nocardia terpenica]|uniref:LysR family transcriptional regulator n=1 Tax=Nocardia terpenica TaxID=455432 RepID=A0A6G9ZCF4_9NOCA|nr:LysR family transcriptional regulator [Nocardia terpenica]
MSAVTELDFRQLEAFVVLSEELHFGRAAVRLHVTPGRVSQLIRVLERQVGEPLFARTSRKVELLAAGEALLAEVEPAYRQLLGAITNARARARGIRGTLRVAYVVTVGMARAHAYVAAFEQEYPEVSVSTLPVNGLAGQLGAPLHEQAADLMLMWFPDNPAKFDGLEPGLTFGPPLYSGPRALAVSMDHPLAQRDSVQAEELADYDMLMPPPSFPDWFVDAWSPPRTPEGKPINRHALVSDWSLDPVIDAVMRTGMVLLATAVVVENMARPGIVLVRVDGLDPSHLVPVWRNDLDSALIQRFVEVAARVM